MGARVLGILGTAAVVSLALSHPARAADSGLPVETVARRLLDAPDGAGHATRVIGLLEEARARAETAEVLTLLAEAYYTRGYDQDDRDRAVEDLDASIARAGRALEIAPDLISARYWRAMSLLGKAGKLRNVESFVLVRQAMRDLEAVAATDPHLDSAGAHRAMGKVYLDSPIWFLGDTDKAIEHLEIARRLAPQFLLNRRFLAEAYAEDGREEDALQELGDLLKIPPVPGRDAEEQKERDRARRLADRLRARLKKP